MRNMKLACEKCGYPIAIKDALFATWKTPIHCQKCEAYYYRWHSLSLLLFMVGCGLSIFFSIMVVFVTKNVTIDKILVVFGLSVVVYIVECLLLPLQLLNFEKKKKIERREFVWTVVFFSGLFIWSIVKTMNF